MKRAHYAGRDFHRAVNIEDLRRIARRRLPNFSFEYVEGGAEDELALRRNRDVFERITWVPRTLASVGTPDLATEILGDSCHLPLVIAPTGFNGLLAAGRPRAREGRGRRGHSVHAQHRFELSGREVDRGSPGANLVPALPDEGGQGHRSPRRPRG